MSAPTPARPTFAPAEVLRAIDRLTTRGAFGEVRVTVRRGVIAELMVLETVRPTPPAPPARLLETKGHDRGGPPT